MKLSLKITAQISLLSVLMLGVSCTNLSERGTNEPNQTEDNSNSTSSNNIHVAFAGGGWRAHTGHTAWISALAGRQTNGVEDVFKDVGTISSNSGGSWFSTKLMYDTGFNKSLVGNAHTWLNQQKQKFKNMEPSVCPSDNITICIVGEQYDTNWLNFISGVVFDQSDISDTLTLSDAALSWAKNKSLLLAGTLLTHDVVLDGTLKGDKSFYWMCPSGSTPFLDRDFLGQKNDGDKGGKCKPDTVKPDVIPVTFSNKAAKSVASSIPIFLKGISPQYNLGYSKNEYSGAPLDTANIANPLVSDGVKIIDAAAASSAATGYLASSQVSDAWVAAFESENLAVSFQLEGGAVKQVTPPPSFGDLSKNKVVRIADGGVVDNTGVAQLMSFLQQTKQDINFKIVSFDSYLIAFAKDDFGKWVKTSYGKDGLSNGMQYLIGDLKSPNPYSFDDVSINLPDLQIFDVFNRRQGPGVAFSNPSCPHEPSGEGQSGKIYISILGVKTRDNPAFGISKGSSGTLFVYASGNSAPTEPEKLDTFGCYSEMLTNMSAAVLGNRQISDSLISINTPNSVE